MGALPRLALGLMMLVCAGCVSLPTSGGVHESDRLPSSNTDQAPIQVHAQSPEPGEEPMGIVRGFLEAMASGRSGAEVAREYLAPAHQADWNPTTTLVYENPPDAGPEAPLRERQQGRVVLEANKLADIGADGTWEPAGNDETMTHHFGLVEVDGEWRIGRPPEGLLMSRYDVDREYERLNRFFYSPDFETLVPDPVFLPLRGTRETLLMQSLLAGPSSWLKPAVRTAIPSGTELATPSVLVEQDLARIDFDDTLLELSGGQRRLLYAQVAWTLREAAVERFQVTVDQSPLQIDGVDDGVQRVDEWAEFDPAGSGVATTGYAVVQGRAVVVDGDAAVDGADDAFVPVAGPLGSGKREVDSVAPDLSGQRLAAVTSDGTEVVVSDLSGSPGPDQRATNSEVVARGQQFAPGSWDRFGRLWLVDRRDGDAELRVVTPRGEVEQVRAPDLAGDVRSLRVARDGVRVAAVIEEDAGSRVVTARIQDADEGLVVDGVRTLQLPLSLSNAEVAWAEIDELVVLGEVEGEQPQPLLVSVDGSMTAGVGSSPLGRAVDSPSSAASVAGAPNAPLLIGSADNWIWAQHPTRGWVRQGEGDNPAYPG